MIHIKKRLNEIPPVGIMVANFGCGDPILRTTFGRLYPFYKYKEQ